VPKECIAKINDPAFTTDEYKAYYKELGVDYLLSPEKITAKEISILLENTAATEIFDFYRQSALADAYQAGKGRPGAGQDRSTTLQQNPES
jgi:Trk K+ transport system NAD-binding subunit